MTDDAGSPRRHYWLSWLAPSGEPVVGRYECQLGHWTVIVEDAGVDPRDNPPIPMVRIDIESSWGVRQSIMLSADAAAALRAALNGRADTQPRAGEGAGG